MWQEILKEIKESREGYGEWEHKDGGYCSFLVEKDKLVITMFGVGQGNLGLRKGETTLRQFIKEAKEKYGSKTIHVEDATNIGLVFWKRMQRKGLIHKVRTI